MRGRKRKPGKREANGRPQRDQTYDRGTPHAQAITALYGTDGCDAIGRAFRAGLLGKGQDAKTMLDIARKLSKAYWAAYQVGPITCTFGDKTSGGIGQIDPEKAKEREQWLSGMIDRANTYTRAKRRCFDLLVLDPHPDHGPGYLDRLIFANRCRSMHIEPTDQSAMRNAITILADLAGVEIPAAQPKVDA